MKAGLRGFASCLAIMALTLPTLARAAIWEDLAPGLGQAAKSISTAVYYRALKADHSQLRQALAAAPLELTSSQGATLTLPLPDGSNGEFEVEESPVMGPALAASYPDIHTYRVRGLDHPAISGRLDLTPAGFHAMLSSPEGTVFIDPAGNGVYRSYYKQDYAQAVGASSDRVCRLTEAGASGGTADAPVSGLAQRTVSVTQRKIYRLAVAVTGEYSQYFNGSHTAIISNVVTTVNRVNQVYSRDLAVQLQLATVVIYDDPATDPYTQTNSSVSTMLSQNQDALNQEVGLDNYDIGHLFGLVGGGLALVGGTCGNSKAMGYTGYPTPDSDVFYIDFVAHEMGHQLNATHSFNGTTGACSGANRTANAAVEPGSGSTIMAYAGICGAENLQQNSDAAFHAESIQQIHTFVFSGGGVSCGSLVGTGDQMPSLVNAGTDVTIPQGTPFVLTGEVGVDPDGDTLSYQWDEMDAGGSSGATDSSTIGTDIIYNPLFRSFLPKDTPTRYFPRLSSLINGTTNIGETLPTKNRSLHFRMTVRDGNSGVADDDVVVIVDASQGPFAITNSTLNNPPVTGFLGGQAEHLAWNPANTQTSCPKLKVSLLSISSDGSTYCDSSDDARLSISTTQDNTGDALVTLPSVQIDRARIMLACANNVFFDLSDNDFPISAPTTPIASNCKAVDGTPLETSNVAPISGGINLPTGGGGGGGGLFWLPLLMGIGGLYRLGKGRR